MRLSWEDDAAMQETLRRHPGLLWKAQNVRHYNRRSGGHDG